MFYYPSILAQFKPESTSERNMWLGIEAVKRFSLFLYKICQHARVNDPSILEDVSDSEVRRGQRTAGESILSLADLQFALPGSDKIWNSNSTSVVKAAGGMDMYKGQNAEQLWLSQAAKVAQPQDERVQWL